MPQKQENDFSIKLKPGTEPISKSPYQMYIVEIRELQVKLQELLDSGKIIPSVSPWEAVVIFVKNNDGSLCLSIEYM